MKSDEDSKESKKKKKLADHPASLKNMDTKGLKKKSSNAIQYHTKKIIHHELLRFILLT